MFSLCVLCVGALTLLRGPLTPPVQIQDFLPAVAPEEEPKGGVKKLAWDDIANPPPGTSRTQHIELRAVCAVFAVFACVCCVCLCCVCARVLCAVCMR